MLGAGGCATPGKRTATGAAAGGIVGAGAGAVAGGWKGAAVGAAAGAAVGAGVGNYLDKRAQELDKVAETRKTDRGLLVNLDSELLFETNSAVLTDQAVSQLTQLGDILSKYPDDRITIEGHTDSRGTEPYNEALSLRRAEAVQRVLRGRGVDDRQMMVLGQGETQPVAPNDTPDGRSANRRVELHIDVPQATRRG
ncbi:OmpA family protein [Pyxidicoccus fallax]|uniref:OmpA family protein n=2 Tax=Pyxidicoccus fallax TaxID=394095 RepID=A0A848LKX3_9BACT|nr:OmpA family protein [Pyxidicoccus fallax]NMO18376.1 OmpA family protein [Pyxidicoccus fallax]NPC83100.1 OmpA family protein [Pyxidicoccus fallax]